MRGESPRPSPEQTQENDQSQKKAKKPGLFSKFADSFGVGKRWEKEAAYIDTLPEDQIKEEADEARKKVNITREENEKDIEKLLKKKETSSKPKTKGESPNAKEDPPGVKELEKKLDRLQVAMARKELYQETVDKERINELIAVLDGVNFGRKAIDKNPNEAQGLEILNKRILTILKDQGVEQTSDALGEKFDPEKHDAIDTVTAPSKAMEGKIIEVVRSGYQRDGKIIRFPQVIVGK